VKHDLYDALPANVDELVAAAAHRSREDVQFLMAHRFPKPDVPTSIRPIVDMQPMVRVSPGTLGATESSSTPALTTVDPPGAPIAPGAGPGAAPVAAVDTPLVIAAPVPPTRVRPLAPGHYELRTTLDQEAYDLLREAQELLSHAIPNRNATEVLKRVLRDWVMAERRRKYGLTDKPRARRSAGDGRYVPEAVRREVFKRDGGRCTFVGDNGRRCGSRNRLEFDHIQPVARGGRTCTENLRLRCRTHNQHEADKVFGKGFMQAKRKATALATPPAISSSTPAPRGTRAASSAASGSSGSRPGSTPAAPGRPWP
jgi:5-methylcytosine-specific restriction endonuclease McrA